MDANSYINIFSTKGIEYILILSFFALFVPFLRMLKEIESPLFALKDVRLPKGVFFDKTHTWAFLNSAGQIHVGIDDFLAAVTGPVTLQVVKSAGDNVQRGDHLATLVNKDRQLKIYSPVSGKLTAVNRSRLKKFSKVTNKEFVENWLFDITPKRWDLERGMMVIGERANQWLQGETARLRDVLAFAMRKYELTPQPILLQEGGEISNNVLESLSPEIWEEFQSEFIDAAKS
ncbi:MAG: hypothetical protein K9M49_03540 [Candidatus Marinimicrobia bacterium]|nr:hypothetical protein [Candidatus Neomarinimicrobiota bacterium]MCF7851374.1 hypothetical protein [Candidatus Neomarinimicrobiota bacterium]MCF7904208.1 hypothetical protein [Candidatus Neomarinimicrobiota bacterium]